MEKYICKVLPTKECNEDFAPDKDMQDGIEVDGFILIGFRDGKPHFESIMGVNTTTISKWIRQQGPGGKHILAASEIARGEIRAAEILDENQRDQGVTLTGKTLPISLEDMRKILGKE